MHVFGYIHVTLSLNVLSILVNALLVLCLERISQELFTCFMKAIYSWPY